MEKKFKVVSLFSGCGGLDLGMVGGFDFLGRKFSRNPFEIVFANDIHEPACDTYDHNLNHTIVREDIVNILNKKLNSIPDCDIVIGGFPCQDFSLSGKHKLFKTKRGRLYQQMIRIIDVKNPLAFIAENVYGLVQLGALERIKNEFSQAGGGYIVTPCIVSALDYGVPQTRKRIFFVGIRKNLNTTFIPPSYTHSEMPTKRTKKWLTSKQVLADLLGKENRIPNHNQFSRAQFYEKRWQGTTYLKPDLPSPTIRAHHHGNIQFHYEGHRRLTVRECARIQTFPDNFIFTSNTSQNYISVGNAVPPILAWHFARALSKALKRLNYEEKPKLDFEDYVQYSFKKYEARVAISN
mgnify:CR=1 FL=1